MLFNSPLHPAILIKRYKRFLADVMLPNQQTLTIHCPNTGAMTGCAENGDTVWYSLSSNPKRKYLASWELTQTKNNDWICVNTLRANQIVKEAIINQQIPELLNYNQIKPEVAYGQQSSRIDLLLQQQGKPNCYVEIKSVTLFDSHHQLGYFPDTVTRRGQKHLAELISVAQQGQRAVIFYLIQHSAINRFAPAAHIDPDYAQQLTLAHKLGVEILCYKTVISPNGISIVNNIPYYLNKIIENENN
ncbi:MAG: DNA/RNA nuclease SfsA [Candidatus Schmidhempelia sp.]|nr:DNA/RNA nuclease SfsA [Candidatus Schmidhempelia sp.]